MSGASAHALRTFRKPKHLRITQKKWNSFLRALDQARFWSLAIEEEAIVSDGSHWVLEGVKDGDYHLVDRWSPQSGKFRAACLRLIKLSEIDVRSVY
jgi:hypothetical protein